MNIWKQMLSKINTFGGLCDRKTVSEFFKNGEIVWEKNCAGYWFVRVNGSIKCAGIPESEIDDCVAYHANRLVQQNITG